MTRDPPRVVFDCVIFAQALIHPGEPSGECLNAAASGHCVLHLSPFVLQEIRELPTKIHPRLGVTPERVEALIRRICDFSILVSEVPTTYVLTADPQDSPYVNLALVTKSNCIVSCDRHLLTLTNPGKSRGRTFMRQFPSLSVMKPTDFLRAL